MSKPKVFAEIPVSFKITQDVKEYIDTVMIERKLFNKSQLHREIFMIGLEQFKQMQDRKTK